MTMTTATPPVKYDALGYVAETASGTRCGNHGTRAYHTDAAAVRECYRISREQAAQVVAEIASELAVERFFEERGGYHEALYSSYR